MAQVSKVLLKQPAATTMKLVNRSEQRKLFLNRDPLFFLVDVIVLVIARWRGGGVVCWAIFLVSHVIPTNGPP